MKVTFTYDSEKYRALKMCAEQKGTTIEAELVQAADALYQKNVPASVKAFIGHKAKTRRSRGNPRGSSSSAVETPPSGD